jgi:Bacterial sugar transferase
MALLWVVITGILTRLVTDEVNAWLPALAQRLVRYNAAKLPPDLEPRLLEEWQADLAQIPGNVSKFLFAFDLARGRQRIIHEWNAPGVPFRPFVLFMIRLLDVLISSLCLVMVLPLCLLIALFIKLASRGPIFWRDPYIGMRGRPLALQRFRTLAFSNGWVVTRIGRILRRSGLDELPQLWHVWTGEMSLIGPRALPTEIVEHLTFHRI